MALGQRVCCVGCTLRPQLQTLPGSRERLDSGEACPVPLGLAPLWECNLGVGGFPGAVRVSFDFFWCGLLVKGQRTNSHLSLQNVIWSCDVSSRSCHFIAS